MYVYGKKHGENVTSLLLFAGNHIKNERRWKVRGSKNYARWYDTQTSDPSRG